MKIFLLVIISNALCLIIGCNPVSPTLSTTTNKNEKQPLVDMNEDDTDEKGRSSNLKEDDSTYLVVEQKATKAGYNNVHIFFVNHGQRLNHSEFLHEMSTNKAFLKKSMREFAAIIRAQKLDKCGFSLTAQPEQSPFFWNIQGRPSTRPCKTPIYPNKTYNAQHQYTDILNANEHINNRKDSTHAIAFNSASMTTSTIRRLIIPKGPYVTIYDFADKANAEEIKDFFALVRTEITRLFIKPAISFSYEVHTGSNYAQAVPHFHLRVYENKS